MPSKFETLGDHEVTDLNRPEDGPRSAHRWSPEQKAALTLAQAARRPLLVRGEPGTGKTQLARAAAQVLGWRLLTEVIHPRFEAQDLIYRHDAIRRLADAQPGGKLGENSDYWEPGVLWRAYGWESAKDYGSCAQETTTPAGHVILIDEIDKADSDLPNSLLEVLGQRSFRIPELNVPIQALPDSANAPLVIITTNEERELPPAFLRRCVVLNLAPKPGQSYLSWLKQRATAHFGDDRPVAAASPPAPKLAPEVIDIAARQLDADRTAAGSAGYKPGAAELLDLLYALHQLAPDDTPRQIDYLQRLSAFVFVKHGGLDDSQPLPGQDRSPVPVIDGAAKS
ncbi:MAG: MoxR family ATPase [Rubrivivax sp.]|nr:MoxR family ATPase [Rubrivivax sp.]